jgi:hypothetical protein
MVIGLVVLAVVSIVLGGVGWFRVVRLMVLYGAVFLAMMYLFGRMRRR